MTEEEMLREVTRARRANIVIFCVFAALFAAAAIGWFVYRHQHTFTQEKWMNRPEHRVDIVDDMLAKYRVIGMTEEEITALLGGDDGKYARYSPEEDSIVYYLGPERGLFSIDSEWLVITFRSGAVSDYTVRTD
ncbi:hypothetical protein [Papillibacter cinnamivorans]|uniref:SmpA / OmlA family protein n=1 Tax=Papillibacter cinnamivorans DSM 12816 TaxID=1122930 RepID=A0A1W2A6L0_9FIRM|nr:hypothetical protein [Papillibacter cinnamivorans]SMC56276.1 hypothetical protein SAMN02745168_1565 [Papillibacter cinnamivorans DSM 12816]